MRVDISLKVDVSLKVDIWCAWMQGTTYPPALLEADSLKLKHVVALNPANMRAEIKAIAHMARTEADVERRV